MTLHDRLLASLEGVAEVSLVSQLRDPRLGCPDESRLNVFLPDIHLVTPRREYLFGTNAPEMLTAVLRGLRDMRAAAAPTQVVVYQLGDLLDLWRETDGLDPEADVASAIEDSRSEIVEALYDPALDAQFVLGNHDYDLYRWPNYDLWQRYYYLLPSVLALHGDVFDWLEQLPDPVENWFVHHFSPSVKPSRAQLEAMRPLNVALRTTEPAGAPARIRAVASPAQAAVRDRFNVQDAQSPPEMLRFFDSARRKCVEVNREFGLALSTTVIGHTHHARIVVDDGPEFFALVDCGAWIEDCVTEDDPTPRPNAQIAAVGANEIRIYQLAENHRHRVSRDAVGSHDQVDASGAL
jgi:UDP-2,3-diacylglucosamine pyrophosphatase LpxH